MPIKKGFLFTAVSISALSLALNGCANTSKTAAGAGIGALTGAGTGALIGSLAGGKDGGWIGALAGAAGGALIGTGIGYYLDEQDRKMAELAQAKVLNQPLQPGQQATTTWKSDHNPNVGGTVVVTNTGQSANGQECRSTTHTVYSGGQEHKETGTSCKDPNTGAWTRTA